jgi:hypothetical protein
MLPMRVLRLTPRGGKSLPGLAECLSCTAVWIYRYCRVSRVSYGLGSPHSTTDTGSLTSLSLPVLHQSVYYPVLRVICGCYNQCYCLGFRLGQRKRYRYRYRRVMIQMTFCRPPVEFADSFTGTDSLCAGARLSMRGDYR